MIIRTNRFPHFQKLITVATRSYINKIYLLKFAAESFSLAANCCSAQIFYLNRFLVFGIINSKLWKLKTKRNTCSLSKSTLVEISLLKSWTNQFRFIYYFLEDHHWAIARNQEELETESTSIATERNSIAIVPFGFVEQCLVLPDGATFERLRSL